MRKYILALFTCLFITFPMTGFAVSVNMNLFDGDLSILDSLLLIAIGITIIGFLLICIAFSKSDKRIDEEEVVLDEEISDLFFEKFICKENEEERPIINEEEPVNDVVYLKITLTGINNDDYKVAPLGDITTFGRRKTNDIIFSDISISGEHGFITVEKDKIYVIDNDSTNGTYINGKRINRKTEIKSGDIITLGQMEYRIGF